MKKLFLILFSLLFIGCTKTEKVYLDINGEQITLSSFVDFELLLQVDNPYNSASNTDLGCYTVSIYVDQNTDVLYVRYRCSMSPIMKADGTCMTYQEVKDKNK